VKNERGKERERKGERRERKGKINDREDKTTPCRGKERKRVRNGRENIHTSNATCGLTKSFQGISTRRLSKEEGMGGIARSSRNIVGRKKNEGRERSKKEHNTRASECRGWESIKGTWGNWENQEVQNRKRKTR